VGSGRELTKMSWNTSSKGSLDLRVAFSSDHAACTVAAHPTHPPWAGPCLASSCDGAERPISPQTKPAPVALFPSPLHVRNDPVFVYLLMHASRLVGATPRFTISQLSVSRAILNACAAKFSASAFVQATSSMRSATFQWYVWRCSGPRLRKNVFAAAGLAMMVSPRLA